MGIPFLIRTSERVLVPSPEDDALGPDDRAALLKLDLGARTWPEGCALFELRGLSASEVRQLAPLLPTCPARALDHYHAVATDETERTPEQQEAAADAVAARLGVAYLEAVQAVYLRAALVSVRGIAGWPVQRDEHLGLRLWPVETLDALPVVTRAWLGRVAHSLSELTPPKGKPSSSQPGGATGTTAAPTSGPTAGASG